MARGTVLVREATPDDVAALQEVWSVAEGRAQEPGPVPHGSAPTQEAAAAVARVALDPDQRVLVGVLESEIVGAAHLVRAPLSPLGDEQAVFVLHLQVREDHRRHGVGHALMAATVGWAEEKATSHVLAAASVLSRDANRFMARLGLCQVAVVRGATVAALRAKLPVEPPAGALVDGRHQRTVGHVLAQRRLRRRAQTRSF